MDSFNFEGVFPQHAGHSHPHLCIIFDTLKSYRRVAFNFIREGLDENEKCIMAVDSYDKSLITKDFAKAGLDIEAYLQSGRFEIIDISASYANNGGFDPDSTIEIWKDESMRAASEGFNALRVVGEATFALEGPGLYEKLIYYENIINQVLFKKYPFKSLCVYEKNRYPAEVIKAAIQAHPVLFYNEELFFENIHYVPPEIHFTKAKAHDEIDRWLKNVRKNNKNLKELKARNERMNLALDFSNEGVWDWNLNTNEIYFSPNWKKLLGYTNDEIKNDFSEWERLTRPEHVKKAWKEFENITSKKRDRFEVEFQMRHKDGRWIDILSRANVVCDSKGKAFRMVGSHVDITDRKQAEEVVAWQAHRNELLSKTASRLLQSEVPHKIVEDLCRSVMDFLDCQAFFNFLADDKTDQLHLNAYAGISEAEAGRIEWLDYGVTVCGCVARNAQRMIVERISSSVDMNTELIKSFGIEAYCCHPIVMQDRVIGTLSFGTRSRSQFQEREIRLMEEVTNLVAVAMSRAESERKVKETSAILQTAMDCSTAGIAIAEAPDGRVRFVNEAALSIRGASKEDLVSDVNIDQYMDNWQILHFDGTPFKPDEVPLARAIKYGERCDRQFIIRRPGNEDRVVWASAAPVFDDHGHVIYGIVVFPDITELKRSEEALRESEEKYRLLVENADDGIYVAQDEKITFLNPGLEKITGYGGDELMQMHFRSFIHPEDWEMVMACYQRCFAGDTPPVHHSFRILHKNGEAHWVEINAALIQWNGKAATLNFLRDITEQKKLETQLQQAQKMESIGRLAGGIAHDFNNKLTIINGYAEMAMGMIDRSDPFHETIQEIHTAGQQSADIVRQLLAFARKQIISPVQLDLNDIISSMLNMLQRLIGENIDLAWHPGNNLWPVKIDPSQVDQIMANLAVNARDAISDVGKLIIETKNTIIDNDYCRINSEAISGRYVMLAVSDNGCGIEKEIMDQLFEPYFTTKEVGKGTGLGLPTIFGIVKQNKGFLSVYSKPGRGTTFKIYLPSCEAEKSSVIATKASTGQMPMGTETILIVEDETTILKLSGKMLTRLGFNVLTAENPNEALRVALGYEGTIDLVITDVVMPDMNGLEMASQLTSSNPDLKVLYMSGYTADVMAHHGVLEEGVQFIQKPFSLKDLAIKVREVIEQE